MESIIGNDFVSYDIRCGYMGAIQIIKDNISERCYNFPKRIELEKEFYKWCRQNHLPRTPFNVITFLCNKEGIKDNQKRYEKQEKLCQNGRKEKKSIDQNDIYRKNK